MNIGIPKNISGRRPRARKWMYAGFLAVLLLAIFVGTPLHQTPPAEAQTATTLVKNTGQTAHSQGRSLSSGYPSEAQAFTTGTSPTGYTLSSIGVNFQSISNPSSAAAELSATLNENDSGKPGNALCILVIPTLTGLGGPDVQCAIVGPMPQPSSQFHLPCGGNPNNLHRVLQGAFHHRRQRGPRSRHRVDNSQQFQLVRRQHIKLGRRQQQPRPHDRGQGIRRRDAGIHPGQQHGADHLSRRNTRVC